MRRSGDQGKEEGGEGGGLRGVGVEELKWGETRHSAKETTHHGFFFCVSPPILVSGSFFDSKVVVKVNLFLNVCVCVCVCVCVYVCKDTLF